MKRWVFKGLSVTDVLMCLCSDEWSSQMLLADSCVVNELVSSVKVENVSAHDVQNVQNPDGFLVRDGVLVSGEALAAGADD